jgi:hypothetical protein
MKRPSASLALLSALAVCLVNGCSAPTEANGDSAEPPSAESDLSASCANPVRYVAVFAKGQCRTVQTNNGRWVPSPLFPGAHPGSSACVYSWSGAAAITADDRKALTDKFGFRDVLTGSCGPTAPAVAEVQQMPPPPSPIKIVGAVGCDVCGFQHGGLIFAVLPAEESTAKFEIELTGGGVASFQVAPPASGARALTATLPPPPAGNEYVDGPFTVH